MDAVDILWHVNGSEEAYENLQLLVDSQDERQRVGLLLKAQRAGDEVQVPGQIGTPQTTIVYIVFDLLAKYSDMYFMHLL